MSGRFDLKKELIENTEEGSLERAIFSTPNFTFSIIPNPAANPFFFHSRSMEIFGGSYYRDFDAGRRISSLFFTTPKKEEKKEEMAKLSNDELAKRFDYWMKNYKHLSWEDNEHLIDWIKCESFILNFAPEYSQFCEVAIAIHKLGYATNPPPSEAAFNEALIIKRERKKWISW